MIDGFPEKLGKWLSFLWTGGKMSTDNHIVTDRILKIGVVTFLVFLALCKGATVAQTPSITDNSINKTMINKTNTTNNANEVLR